MLENVDKGDEEIVEHAKASEDKRDSRDRLRDSDVLVVRTRSVQREKKVKA